MLLQVRLLVLERLAMAALLVEFRLQPHGLSANLVVATAGIGDEGGEFFGLVGQGMGVGVGIPRAIDDLGDVVVPAWEGEYLMPL
jgi:hypothetical protein